MDDDALRPDLGSGHEVLLEQLAPGIRMRLFVDATLIGYGEWTYRSTPAASAASLSAAAPPACSTTGPL